MKGATTIRFNGRAVEVRFGPAQGFEKEWGKRRRGGELHDEKRRLLGGRGK